MRRRPTALVAILLDAVAVGLLLVDVAAASERNVTAVLLLSVAGVGFAVAGSVTSGIHLARRYSTIPRRLAFTVVVLVTSTIVPVGGSLLALAAGATPNPAADAEARLGRTIESAGGHRLCSSGDPGLGPDSTQPYVITEYDVPAGSALRAPIAARAKALGWTVSSDPSGDASRTVPRVELHEGGTVDEGACGVFGSTVRASRGAHLLEVRVLLPYRR